MLQEQPEASIDASSCTQAKRCLQRLGVGSAEARGVVCPFLMLMFFSPGHKLLGIHQRQVPKTSRTWRFSCALLPPPSSHPSRWGECLIFICKRLIQRLLCATQQERLTWKLRHFVFSHWQADSLDSRISLQCCWWSGSPELVDPELQMLRPRLIFL